MYMTSTWRNLCAGLIILSPVTPTLLTNFFASRGEEKEIHCENYSVRDSPEECRDAHASVVIWQSWSSFVANSLICFLLVSLFGKCSGTWALPTSAP